MSNTLPRTSLAGKTVVFTGTLSSMTRNEAKAAAARLGAVISDTVNTATDYVVAGPGAGSKLRKAKLIGCVEVISEAEWQDIMASAGSITGFGANNKIIVFSTKTAYVKTKTTLDKFPELDLD